MVVHICGKELLDDQHSCAEGCWVATGLSLWMGCSDPQGSGRGRESINPAKMKLCLGSPNLFASTKLYKWFAMNRDKFFRTKEGTPIFDELQNSSQSNLATNHWNFTTWRSFVFYILTKKQQNFECWGFYYIAQTRKYCFTDFQRGEILLIFTNPVFFSGRLEAVVPNIFYALHP